MFLGRVIGKVVATRKNPELEGGKLLIVEPMDENKNPEGKPIIAVDTLQAGYGDYVYLVKSREASIAWKREGAPIDAAIVGIIDGMTGH